MATSTWLLLSLTVALTAAAASGPGTGNDLESLSARVAVLEERLNIKPLDIERQQQIVDLLLEFEQRHLKEYHANDKPNKCHMNCGAGHSWGYGEADGANCWGDCTPQCKGVAQSPIDLKSSLSFPRDFNSSVLTLNGYDAWRDGMLKNNGHTATVELTGDAARATIQGTGLTTVYQVAQFHFHWGATNARGSEHRVDGTMYPMEMHIVHYNTNYNSLGEAADKPRGLAVLGFFFIIMAEDNPAFEFIISKLGDVKQPGSSIPIEPFRLIDLIPNPNELIHFFRYEGSLTTPPCYETVTWTVFTQGIGISERQLNAFRQLRGGHHGHEHAMLDNYRPPMPVDGRPVYYLSMPGVGA